ncbi:MAG: type II secretion system protein GspK, partial [Gammaproteobacteria bacterium]|nr:type II secretion system protein GspK [Gammaproteobacteria bacterium]
MSTPSRQRGVALITAILITALVSSVALSLAWDNALDMRRTMTLLYRDQAVHVAMGGESWVQSILRDDLSETDTDHLGEIWASELPGLPVQSDVVQGELFGSIEDLQGRFNVNNLIDQNGEVDELAL